MQNRARWVCPGLRLPTRLGSRPHAPRDLGNDGRTPTNGAGTWAQPAQADGPLDLARARLNGSNVQGDDDA